MELLSSIPHPLELSCLVDFTPNYTAFFESTATMEPNPSSSTYYLDRLRQESPHGLYGLATSIIGHMLDHARGLNIIPPIDMHDISRLENNQFVKQTLFQYDSNNPQLTLHYRPTPSHRELEVANLFEDTTVSVIESWLMEEQSQPHVLGMNGGQAAEDHALWRLVTSLVVDTAVAATALFRTMGVPRDQLQLYRYIQYQPTRYNPYVYLLIFSQVDGLN